MYMYMFYVLNIPLMSRSKEISREGDNTPIPTGKFKQSFQTVNRNITENISLTPIPGKLNFPHVPLLEKNSRLSHALEDKTSILVITDC